MYKIVLTIDGDFFTENIHVLSKEKNGKFLGVDKNKNKIYEQMPSKVWKTTIGNFSSHLLDKARYTDNNFEIFTEGEISIAKAKVKEYAEKYLSDLAKRHDARYAQLIHDAGKTKHKYIEACMHLENTRGAKID